LASLLYLEYIEITLHFEIDANPYASKSKLHFQG